MLEAQTSQDQPESGSSVWHVVVVPQSNNAAHLQFTERYKLLEWLKSQMGTHSQIYVFTGQRWNLSVGRPKYLVAPDGVKYQIDNPLGVVEIDPDSFIDS